MPAYQVSQDFLSHADHDHGNNFKMVSHMMLDISRPNLYHTSRPKFEKYASTLMFKYWVCLCLDVCSLKVLTRHAVRRACSSSPNFLPITISAGEASQITSLQVPNTLKNYLLL